MEKIQEENASNFHELSQAIAPICRKYGVEIKSPGHRIQIIRPKRRPSDPEDEVLLDCTGIDEIGAYQS